MIIIHEGKFSALMGVAAAWSWSGKTIAAQPGRKEYTLPLSIAHYTLPESRADYTMPLSVPEHTQGDE